MLGHKASLKRHKKIEKKKPSVLSDHHGFEVDFNNDRKSRKCAKLNNFILNEFCAKAEVNRETTNFLEFNEKECTTPPDL